MTSTSKSRPKMSGRDWIGLATPPSHTTKCRNFTSQYKGAWGVIYRRTAVCLRSVFFGNKTSLKGHGSQDTRKARYVAMPLPLPQGKREKHVFDGLVAGIAKYDGNFYAFLLKYFHQWGIKQKPKRNFPRAPQMIYDPVLSLRQIYENIAIWLLLI